MLKLILMPDHTHFHPDTLVIHAGQRPEPITGAVMPPIFTSSTYAQKSPGEHSGFEYSRSHNPTRYALERMVALLEGSTIDEKDDPSCGGYAFSSGLAAMDCVLELLTAGDEVVCMDDVYGGSNRQLRMVKARSQGLKEKFVDMTNLSKLEAALTPQTRLVWVETPTNPMLKVVDLEAIAKLVHERCAPAKYGALPNGGIAGGTLLVCDNTFASPINQRPMALGFDVAMHSATKYLGGHSDVVGGLLATSNLELAKRIRFHQNAVGAVMGAFDAYLVLRGIKTLALRMERHNQSALKIARWLESHSKVERVIYPGLPSHPQHDVARKQMVGPGGEGGKGGTVGGRGGFGGMITFLLKGDLAASRRFLERVHLFTLAESLGGVESLIEHPAIMTHASVPEAQRAQLGITDNLIRLSVGVEDVGDLMADLEQGFAAV